MQCCCYSRETSACAPRGWQEATHTTMCCIAFTLTYRSSAALYLSVIHYTKNMPVSCCAPDCSKRFLKGSGVSFFRFPTEPGHRLLWRKALKRMCLNDQNKLWEPSEHDRLCGLHFISG